MGDCISLELRYQSLRSSSYSVTSPKTPNYNCVAWAAGEDHRPWWPIPYDTAPYYWPLGEQEDESLEVFIDCFRSLGYEMCDDDSFEQGFEKVAIYVDEEDDMPSHMARQLESGCWTSKCGDRQDITHQTLSALEGGQDYGYGKVTCIMKRKRSGETV
jgi:hypothetical protein